MNIHTLNDLSGNNNNNYNNNGQNYSQNNQLFLAGMGPDNSDQNSFCEQLFPRSVYKMKSVSFSIICIITAIYIIQLFLYYSIYDRNGYSWSCLLYNLGASEISSVVNHFQYFRLITPILTHNNFGHLFSNAISIAFIGFYVEYDLKNPVNYILLFLISGVIGNFMSMLFNYQNISMGASGAILGLCGYYVLFFVLNWEKMNNNQKCCSILFFAIIFMNLFSGVSVGSNNVDMSSHVGGFLGGLAFSMILIYRSQVLFSQRQYMKLAFYASILFLIGLPLISLVIINLKDIPDNCAFICLTQKF